MSKPAVILEVVFETRDGARLARKSNEHGDPSNLERYSSPGGEIEIRCSTEEREESELNTGIRLTSDMLTASEFEELFRSLRRDARLRLFGIFTRANPFPEVA